jgi:hypothetical protein
MPSSSYPCLYSHATSSIVPFQTLVQVRENSLHHLSVPERLGALPTSQVITYTLPAIVFRTFYTSSNDISF